MKAADGSLARTLTFDRGHPGIDETDVFPKTVEDGQGDIRLQRHQGESFRASGFGMAAESGYNHRNSSYNDVEDISVLLRLSCLRRIL